MVTPARRAPARGFTLIELLIVVALIAIASTVTALALRDPSVTRLEREAARLAALLEGARAESRAAGIPVLWMPVPDGGGFRFVGLPRTVQLPTQWLGEGMSAEVLNSRGAAPAASLTSKIQGHDVAFGVPHLRCFLYSRVTLRLRKWATVPTSSQSAIAPLPFAPVFKSLTMSVGCG